MSARLDDLLVRAARESVDVRRLTAELTFVRRELDAAAGRLKAIRDAIDVAIDEEVDQRTRKLVQP